MAEGGSARSCGSMTLRPRPPPNYEMYRDENDFVLDTFIGLPGKPRLEEGAGCAWRNKKGRHARSQDSFQRMGLRKYKKSARFDVEWEVRHNGHRVRVGVHPVERSSSTASLQGRKLRRGVKVMFGSRFHEYIPAHTFIPGAIYGLEYTKQEVELLKEKYADDKNIMWALEHSTVEIPPRLQCEKHLPKDNLIVPDLKFSGTVILINNGSLPNCVMLAEWFRKSSCGRWFWAVRFKTTKDVRQGEELIDQYIHENEGH